MVEYNNVEYNKCVIVEENKIIAKVMNRCSETSTAFEYAGTVMSEGKKGVIYMKIIDFIKAKLEEI
jgi:hypothetical protein